MKLYKNAYLFKNDQFVKRDFLIDEGKFLKIGEVIEKNDNDEVIDLSGKYVYPGLMDAHTHVGIFQEKAGNFAGDDVNESTSSSTADCRAMDAINPFDPGVVEAKNNGVTTVCVLPGSGNVIGGEGVVFKTNVKNVYKERVKTPKRIIKLAFGWSPTIIPRMQKRKPLTRLAVSAILRENLEKAKNYIHKEEKDYDLSLENLSLLLKNEAIARIHVANLEDIETIVRIMKEYKIDYVLDHATALHTNTEFAKSLNVPVILGPLNVAGKAFQTWHLSFNSVKDLYDAGIDVSIMTDAPVIPLKLIRLQMFFIDRLKIKRSEILKMFTLNPAKVLGLQDRLGSVDEGKDADFILMDGDIFDYRSKVLKTYINGIHVGGEEI